MEAWRSSGLFEQVEASRSSRVRFVGVAVHDWAAADVTPGIFDLLDVRPIRGRGFSRDAGVMATDEVIVSETVWRSVFGGDPAVIGRRIATADGSAVVVGIMPSRFRFPTSSTVVWRPLYPVARERGLFTIYGRLIAGVPVNAALEARLRVLAMELARLPRNYAGPPLRQVGVPDLDEATTRGLWLLFGGAALVFVALCTNVCGLVLSVLAARRRELGTCAALGASRARLVREAIVEHSVIGAGGIVAGVWMAWAATTAVPHVFPGPHAQPHRSRSQRARSGIGARAAGGADRRGDPFVARYTGRCCGLSARRASRARRVLAGGARTPGHARRRGCPRMLAAHRIDITDSVDS